MTHTVDLVIRSPGETTIAPPIVASTLLDLMMMDSLVEFQELQTFGLMALLH